MREARTASEPSAKTVVSDAVRGIELLYWAEMKHDQAACTPREDLLSLVLRDVRDCGKLVHDFAPVVCDPSTLLHIRWLKKLRASLHH